VKATFRIFYVTALIACISILFNNDTQAQSPEAALSLPIAIVDMKAIRQQSTAVAGIREQITQYRSGFQTQIQQEEEQLRSANQELARQRSILSAEAFAEERKKFESRLAEVQRIVQKRRQELDQLRDTAMADVQKTLNSIIAEIANERGVVLVLQRAQTVLAARSLEITSQVIERLNTNLPSVVVPPPGN